MKEKLIDYIREIVEQEQIQTEEPMSRHTTFRVGGPAEFLVTPKVQQAVELINWCRREAVPYTVIGNGSNLLVGDNGIRGIVIEFGKYASAIAIEGEMVYAEAGAMLSKTANEAAEAGLGGMEFAAGIPGTIGGAVVMNAGAYGGEMKDIVESVQVLTKDGSVLEICGDEMEFAYRHSKAMDEDYIILGARLRLKRDEKEAIRARMNELKSKRIEKQPLEYPSAGSTFKRPEGHFAGKLIMDAGLRGFRVGDAQVSEKHCGFVVNRGKATAAEIVTLMREVQDKVEEQFSVRLEPEVRRIGDFS